MSMESSRQEYWSGFPFPSQGIFLTQGLCWVFCIAGRFFTIWAILFRSSTNFIFLKCQYSSVHSLSHIRLSVTPRIAACQASLSITNSRILLKLMSIDSVMPCKHLILCHPLLLLPSIFPRIRVFSNESALYIRWPKTGVSTSTSVLPINIQKWFPLGWTGWISLQSKGLSRVFSNTTVQKHQFLQHSAFFIVQISHPYMTTGKPIALVRQTFVGKVMSLLFNMLSRLVITFLPRSKHLFISWLQSPSAVIFGAKKK